MKYPFRIVRRIIETADGNIVSFEQSENGEFFFMDYVRSHMKWNVHGKNDVLPHWWYPV